MRAETNKRIRGYIITGLVTAISYIIVYMIEGFAPFGEGSVVAYDLHSQYLPLLYRFYDIVTGAKSVFVDLHVGGGMNLFADSVIELINPFNYFLLIFGRENLQYSINLMPVLYGVAASMTSFSVLQRLYPKNDTVKIALCIAYAMSFFSAYQFEIIRWMFLVVLFPLFYYSIIKLLRDGKPYLFIFLSAYQLMLSLQIGIMALGMTLVISAFWLVRDKHTVRDRAKSHSGGKCFLLLVSTAAGILISGIVTVPEVINLLTSTRSGQNDVLTNVVTSHGLDNIGERLMEIINPVILGVIAWGLIRAKGNIRKILKENRALLGLLILLLATVILEPSNLIWHLGSYRCFPVRYGFMVVFLTVIWAMDIEESSLNYVESISVSEIFNAFISGLSVILSVCCLFVVIIFRLEFSQAFGTLNISEISPKQTLIYYIILLLLMVFAILGMYASGKNLSVSGSWAMIALAAVSGMCVYLCILLPQSSEARLMNEWAYYEMNEYASTHSSEYTGHAEDIIEWPLNRALVTKEYSMTAYLPSGTGEAYTEAMKRLGYNVPWISVRSTGGTCVSDMVLGIENELLNKNGYEPASNGIILSDQAYEMIRQSNTEDSIDNQKALLNALCYDYDFIPEEIMTVMTLEDYEKQRISKDSYTIDENYVYLDAYTDSVSIYLDGEEVVSEDYVSDSGEHSLFFVGQIFGRGKPIAVHDINGDLVNLSKVKLCIVNIEKFYDLAETIRIANSGHKLIMNDSEGSITVSGEEPISGNIILPLAYIDGLETHTGNIGSFLGGLLAVSELSEENEIKIEFSLPGLVNGIVVSFVGLVVLTLIFLFRSILSRKRFRIFYTVFMVVFAIFFLAVYVLPNLMMVGYMGFKLFGVDVLEKEVPVSTEPILLSSDITENGIDVVIGRENLLLNKHVRLSCDSVEDRKFGVELVRDGETKDYLSRWSSKNDWENCDHYLSVDFREAKEINAVRIYWERLNACEYSIEVSEDGKEWVAVEMFNSPSASNPQVITFENEVSGRYLRLHVTDVLRNESDQSLYYQNVSVKELEVYGGDCDSFTIMKPALTGEENRKIPIPEVPEGYSLSVGGIDYENLMTEDGYFGNNISDVPINLGYILSSEGINWNLPGMDLVLPATVTAGTSSWPYRNIKVAEWCGDGDFRKVSDLEEIDYQVNEDLLEELGEEGYIIKISGGRNISVETATVMGSIWAEVTLNHMFEEMPDEVPVGTIRDYPRYSVRGFVIDLGRRPISVNLLKKTVDLLSERKMNTLQLHFNDNAIIADSNYDGTMEGALGLYSGFRLPSSRENEKGERLESSDFSYSYEEIRELIEYAQFRGVSIVPEIDTPAHSLAITKVFPEFSIENNPETADVLDISKDETISFVKELIKDYYEGGEYPLFDECDTIHLGMDEFYGDVSDFHDYIIDMESFVNSEFIDKDIRMWGSLTYRDMELRDIPKDIQIMIWSTVWTDPEVAYRSGFEIINCLNTELYIIPGGGYDRLDKDYLAKEWKPNVFRTEEYVSEIPSWDTKMLGACYSLWNDLYIRGLDNSTEKELFERIEEPAKAIADKLW